MYLAVSGNIGSGKTTLVELISKRFGSVPFYENIENPYLDDFYQDMARWSFNLQICFLGNKARQIMDIRASKYSIVQDRTLMEEGHIFVRNLHDMALMSTRDYNTYQSIFTNVEASGGKPDLVIFLKGSVDTLIKQIERRGRAYEMNIDRGYLEALNNLYNDWIENIYRGEKLIIDIDSIDFVDNTSDREELFARIETELARLNLTARKRIDE